HCPGIGLKTERELWNAGAHTWSDFLQISDSLPIGPKKKEALSPLVEQSVDRLKASDYKWFAKTLQQREHWRAFSKFNKRVAYLDIETAGMDPSSLTVVGQIGRAHV